MLIPLIRTKITVPAPPSSYLPRPRLDALADAWRGKRLVLVAAGAGFGKTSFLAARARDSKEAVSWFTLDEIDTDFDSFETHLRTAVCGGEANRPAGGNVESGDAPRRLLADIVHSLRGTGRILILDDVHLVSGSVEVLDFLHALIRYLPDGCTLVLSSREHLDRSVTRLRTGGLAASLESADLAFTAE